MNYVCSILILICLFVSGCSSNGSFSAPEGRIGTSDSGGGNGIENKAYEAFIVQPENLPAVRALIMPKLAQIAALNPNPAKAMAILRQWLFYKTWFVAPVKLDTISNEIIGVYSQNSSDQLAIQTKKSIWINSDRFAQMSSLDQATLVAHEMVMSLYYLKFKSWDQVCDEGIYDGSLCSTESKTFWNELFPGTTPKPFDRDDYENIRRVTGILLYNSSFKTTKELDDLLVSNHFDQRFTYSLGFDSNTGDSHGTPEPSIELPVAEFTDLIDRAKILNQFPDECRGFTFQTRLPCQLKFAEASRKIDSGYSIPILRFDLVSRAVNFGFSTFGIKTILGSARLYKGLNRRISMFVFTPEPNPTQGTIGTHFRSAVVVTAEDLDTPNPQRNLLGIISVPGVITGSIAGGRDCIWSKPYPRDLESDMILIQAQGASDYDQKFLRASALWMQPATSCRKI